MSKKNRALRELSDASNVATEALPADQMNREQMLEHMSHADPGTDFSQLSDEDLREFVKNDLTDAPMTAGEVADEQPETPVTDQPIPEETPTESAIAEQTLDDEIVENLDGIPADAAQVIMNLRAEIAKLKTKSTSKRVKSGSKARPSVKYTLLNKPPSWHNTPQVASIEQILFDPAVEAKYGVEGKDGKRVVEIPEPEIFDLIRAGAASGKLRTKQDPVRIFQYYRNDLLLENALRWQ